MKATLKIVTILALMSFSFQDEYQDLIITKQGEIFLCEIEKVTDDSVQFSFIIYDQTFHDAVPADKIAYHGKDFIREQAETDEDEFTKDLIVTMTGEKLACSIEGIDPSAVQYAFFMNNMVMENTIDKSDVHYIVKNYQGVKAEQIILTPRSTDDFSDLIVTAIGSTIVCFIDHEGTNTVEYYINEDGNTTYQIIKKDEVLYFGPNFLDVIEGQEKQQRIVMQH